MPGRRESKLVSQYHQNGEINRGRERERERERERDGERMLSNVS